VKIVLIFWGMVLLISPLHAQEGTKGWSFDNDQAGSIARDFMNASGEWKVVVDSTPPSQPHVPAQVAKKSGSILNVALVSGANYKDLRLLVKMKAIAGKKDQGGGLIRRVKDSKNYYIARFNPLEDNSRLYKVEKGKRVLLRSAEVKHAEGWHQLRVFMKGGFIRCYYDDKMVLQVTDSTFQGPSTIGLCGLRLMRKVILMI
jgi:hypothetical protein